MLILMLMLSPGPEMDTRICRDGPSHGATEDHYSPQKGSPTQPNRDPPQILQIVPPRCCLHHHHHHQHHQYRREVSPPADGGGGAAPDAPERSQEGDLASPALPLRGRLPSPHLLPPLITKCKTSPTSSSSTRPLVVDEAELRHTTAPARLDGVHVRGPPLHRHPQLLIPSQQQKSCSKLGIPTGHRHTVTCQAISQAHTGQSRRGHHCAGRRAAAN